MSCLAEVCASVSDFSYFESRVSRSLKARHWTHLAADIRINTRGCCVRTESLYVIRWFLSARYRRWAYLKTVSRYQHVTAVLSTDLSSFYYIYSTGTDIRVTIIIISVYLSSSYMQLKLQRITIITHDSSNQKDVKWHLKIIKNAVIM